MVSGDGGAGRRRRRGLQRVACAGSEPAISAAPFAPVGRAPRGARVLVLGAGIAGLTVAYELQKLGYDCEVLEARARVGGRATTVRRGAVSEEVGPRSGQTCDFDEGQYFNPGPMRIPNTHATTLAYCRELNVPLEMFTTVNEAAYVYRQTVLIPPTAKMRLRELHADWRGITSEMLAKVVAQDSLDICSRRRTRRASSTGCVSKAAWTTTCATAARHAGASVSRQARRSRRRYDRSGLAHAIAADHPFRSLTTEIQMQTPMFQLVGGMDGCRRRWPHACDNPA